MREWRGTCARPRCATWMTDPLSVGHTQLTDWASMLAVRLTGAPLTESCTTRPTDGITATCGSPRWSNLGGRLAQCASVYRIDWAEMFRALLFDGASIVEVRNATMKY